MEAQMVGKTQEICDPSSAFAFYYTACVDCVNGNTSGNNATVAASELDAKFGQYSLYCSGTAEKLDFSLTLSSAQYFSLSTKTLTELSTESYGLFATYHSTTTALVPIMSAFTFTTTVPSPTTVAVPTTATVLVTQTPTPSGSGSAWIAGAATGSIAGAAMIFGALLYRIRRRKQKRASAQSIIAEVLEPDLNRNKEQLELHGDSSIPRQELDGLTENTRPKEMEASPSPAQELEASPSPAQELEAAPPPVAPAQGLESASAKPLEIIGEPGERGFPNTSDHATGHRSWCMCLVPSSAAGLEASGPAFGTSPPSRILDKRRGQHWIMDKTTRVAKLASQRFTTLFNVLIGVSTLATLLLAFDGFHLRARVVNGCNVAYRNEAARETDRLAARDPGPGTRTTSSRHPLAWLINIRESIASRHAAVLAVRDLGRVSFTTNGLVSKISGDVVAFAYNLHRTNKKVALLEFLEMTSPANSISNRCGPSIAGTVSIAGTASTFATMPSRLPLITVLVPVYVCS
ncbi:hypothetical protein B0T26DRAFT_680690 [Lasiosphaeria miniovina]|uniref:Uncharacterized protein n=1 Tax=Lasiosphaeria miniovina TaxID=1954250 RepID=A0AA40A0L6_9PEZI|nr:uncharacterized protein B0T26DRAFT_680690 [Lasiosphaeria miniovina]KAK0707126.1 hypothetical protein B0T26DRAFT_680690 [Lasiosphaeria miniovina]